VELLSSAKREWEKTVDAISQAICIVDATHGGAAQRVFADLIPDRGHRDLPDGRGSVSCRPLVDPVARAIASRRPARRKSARGSACCS